MAHGYWPLFDLRIRTPRLELRPPTDDDLPALIAAADAGIHDADAMPFARPWTDAPAEDRARTTAQFLWRSRAGLRPEAWELPLAVLVDGTVVGIQAIEATEFPTRRQVETGSWLTRAEQGKAYGKEMRAAVLELAFAGLGAELARSESFLDNEPSIRVSRALGYEEDGSGRHAPRGEPRDTIRWRLTRDRWLGLRREGRYPDVVLEGVADCAGLLGAG